MANHGKNKGMSQLLSQMGVVWQPRMPPPRREQMIPRRQRAMITSQAPGMLTPGTSTHGGTGGTTSKPMAPGTSLAPKMEQEELGSVRGSF